MTQPTMLDAAQQHAQQHAPESDQQAPHLWNSPTWNSPVGDLGRQGERAALAAGVHFPRAVVLAAGELRVAHVILAALVPPLVERDPMVYGYAITAAAALRRAWDDPHAARDAADRLYEQILDSPLRFARPNANAIKLFVLAAQNAPDPVRRLFAARHACMCFSTRDLAESVRDWTPDRHIEVARALAAELHPPGDR